MKFQARQVVKIIDPQSYYRGKTGVIVGAVDDNFWRVKFYLPRNKEQIVYFEEKQLEKMKG